MRLELGDMQGREELKSHEWRLGLEVVMARKSHQKAQVSVTSNHQQAERKQCS